MPELPDHYSKKMAKQIRDVVRPKRKNRERLSADDVDKIRMSFFSFFVGVFQDYEKYMISASTGSGPAGYRKTVDGVGAFFNFTKYKDESPNDQKPFFKHFLHMQMFTRLLERKLWASKNEDVTDMAFFDEHIRLKHIRNR